MEAKTFAMFALLFVVVAVFVPRTESTPIPNPNELDQANLADSIPSADNMKAPMDKGQREGRFYGFGWPGYGYGGLGGYGGSSATAAATASATSTGSGMGFPYGK